MPSLMRRLEFVMHKVEKRNGNRKSWYIKELEKFQAMKRKNKEKSWKSITNTPKLNKSTKNGLTTVTIPKSENKLKGGK